MIIETLKEQWLSENEAKTYVAVLSLWIATITEIARKVNERRENVYYTLENLQKKWYISCITKNNVNNYTALDPRELHEKVQNKAHVHKTLLQVHHFFIFAVSTEVDGASDCFIV